VTKQEDIRTGDLVDLYDEGGLVCAVVLGEEKGRLKVQTQAGRTLRVTLSRVAQRLGLSALPTRAAETALAHALAAQERLDEIDIAALWDVLVDEPSRHSLQSLAALALGEDGPVARSALLRKLFEDRVYFTRKGDDFEPRSRDHVEATFRREAAEAGRLRRREAFLREIREALAGGGPRPGVAAEHEGHVADLVELAIMGDEAASRKSAQALLDEAGAPPGASEERAFDVLRALGLFTPDENLYIHRFRLRTAFPRAVEEAAERQAAIEPDRSVRRDLRDHVAFTIDDEQTTEVDDALSVERLASGTRLGIHIADPGCFVRPGDPVDLEALDRAATHYFPELKLPMMPSAVAESAASLVPRRDRPALSFLVTLSPLGEVVEWEVLPSMIRSRMRLTYEEAEKRLSEDPGGDAISVALSTLDEVSRALEAERIAAGAVVIRAAEISIRVDGEGQVSIRRVEDRGPARRLVSEAMILANRLAAEFCIRRGVPAIFRRQDPPDQPLPPGGDPEAGYDPVSVRARRRAMRRADISLEPAPHSGLGLEAYTQATSPIRRYQDLVVHRQIKASLLGETLPYDRDALARIAATTEEAERAARQAERGTAEYWILRHYASRAGQEVEATVVHADDRRREVELDDTLYAVRLAPRPDQAAGHRLRLRIEEARPRSRRLVLTEVIG